MPSARRPGGGFRLWHAEMMRAITMSRPGGPEVLRLDEVDPPLPATDEVLIKVAAAGINRADLLQRQGHYSPPPGASEIIGLEVSGQIAATGADVEGWQPGDRCVALLAGGGYAEYVAVSAGQVIEPPPGMDLLTAGGVVEVAATVYSNLERARLADGEMFLVHGGAGGIGSFAIPYAKACGTTVITTAGSQEKIDYCRSLGADHALSYRDEWQASIMDITAGNGVDVILDNMGAKYLDDHVRLLARDGRLLVIGLQGGRQATLDLAALHSKRGSITAASLRSRPTEQKAAICRGVVEHVWPMFADGRIQPPRITSYRLGEAAIAHARLESGENLGKLILIVDPGL
jgi:putative PIG3 family NAD(P)H quinone oxidoreductase